MVRQKHHETPCDPPRLPARHFRNDCESDTGYETLKAILTQQDMDTFTAQWTHFTLSLTFP
jgi:hypothetical protein